MGLIIYHLFLKVYKFSILFATLFSPKAKLWIKGRKDIFSKLEESIRTNDAVIWMHCASLGEFEQGRPVLEKIKQQYPTHKILLTFFSPSGYEIRKNYAAANWVFYLPLDTRKNAVQFIKTVNPRLAIFVKYEYWYNYLNQLSYNKIPTILISAIFRENAVFFKWYGGLHRKMLNFFSHLFVQNVDSFNRVKNIVPTEKITRAGDTRFDRVVEIANAFEPLPAIEKFVPGKNIIVAGSTWPDDEQLLKKLISSVTDISLIIAPHEIKKSNIEFLKSNFPASVLYSELLLSLGSNQLLPKANVLIIDNIGMLSKLYYYSAISYIGGGFNKSGIHNTLEAAVYGKPVIFGPNYKKFAEANGLIKNGGAYAYKEESELIERIKMLTNNRKLLEASGTNAKKFVEENIGATQKILNWLRQTAF